MKAGENIVQYIYTKKLVAILPQTGEGYLRLFTDMLPIVSIFGAVVYIFVKKKRN